MNNYLHRLGLTAWRKKTTVLVIIAVFTLIMYGLHYTHSYQFKTTRNKEGTSEATAEQLKQNYKINVKFVDHKSQFRTETDNLVEEDNKVIYDTDQSLGIPLVNLNLDSPYIPKQRIVHFDLKGAPLQPNFYRKIFPMIKNMGATGILLEYEDMFPYSGILKSVPAHNAYTVEQIKEILLLADELKLEVIPLVQTFGHLEYVLKHSEFIKYREVPGSPQALCPSRNTSTDIILEIVNQV
ncbi:hypothetical protein MML48_5g00006849 [Holotrichia oblita]|uniref:Uncharacterized protein n=1 Tax=Holotrichia oblita TaxID=644536 RepID=A0ACB9T4L9_HOLOL|nr:hypothetical protein MML48_5g00006849 [Holotrichia oblita]